MMDSSLGRTPRRLPFGALAANAVARDAALACATAIAVFVFGATTNAVEAVFSFSRAHGDFAAEALLLALIGAGLGGFVFGLRRLQGQRYEIARRMAAEDEVSRLALHDPLTGLPNRRLFEDRLEAAVKRAEREGEMLAVLMVDLDRFKPINDLHGHAAGDRLLQGIKDRLRSVLRAPDTLARLGGDEFAIVQNGVTQPSAALRLARRLIGVTEEPFSLRNGRVTVGLSMGIAVYPTDSQDPEELLRMAGVALDRAKAAGRSTFRFFETEMDAQLQERAALEHDLHVGIHSGQIEPYYQPIVDLSSGGLIGFEALARWNHPERGLMLPDSFVSLAEDSGMIGELGEAVLRQACRDALGWPGHMSLAVNLSPLQFRNPTIAEDILAVLREDGFPPERLEIEVTENAFIDDPKAAGLALQKLKERGVRIALDDFGTGYSSLAHLRDFAFDKIKIDRSFIAKLEEQGDSTEIVRAVIALGHSLNLPTTAEGIELETHLAALNDQGCTQGQGFLFGHPVPAHELTAKFEEESKAAAVPAGS